MGNSSIVQLALEPPTQVGISDRGISMLPQLASPPAVVLASTEFLLSQGYVVHGMEADTKLGMERNV
jgi:hypothetical protein